MKVVNQLESRILKMLVRAAANGALTQINQIFATKLRLPYKRIYLYQNIVYGKIEYAINKRKDS